MQYYLFFVLLLVCSLSNLNAQDITIESSKVYNGGTFPKLLNFGSDIAVIEVPPNHQNSSASKKFGDLEYLNVHRFNHKLENTMTYELDWKNRRENIGVFSIGNSLLWLFKSQEKKKDSISINAQLIDKEGNLNEITQISKYGPDLYLSVEVTPTKSQDNSKILFTFLQKRFGLKKKTHNNYPNDISFVVFSESGEMLTSIIDSANINTDSFVLQSCHIDNDGNGYVAGKKSIRKTGRLINLLNQDTLEIYRFQNQGKRLSKVEIEPKNIAVDKVSFLHSNSHVPTLFGTYGSDSAGQHKVIGTFFLHDLTESQSLSLLPFSDHQLDILSQRAILGRHKDKSLPTRFYEVHGSRKNNDGSLTVLLEGHWFFDNRPENPYSQNTKLIDNQQISGKSTLAGTEDRYSSGDGTTTSFNQRLISASTSTSTTILTGRTYFKEEIPKFHMFYEGIILSLTKEGEIFDPLLIPKFQRSSFIAEKWSRMHLTSFEGTPALLYNEKPKNLGRDIEKRPKAVKKPEDSVAILGYKTQSGNINRRKLISSSAPEGMVVLPESVVTLPSGIEAYLAQPINPSDDQDYIIIKVE